ncbi:Lipase [Apiospora marii]|uniref:Lipase n=1 Tax=Apiospora marii TaxID=335849 RepID=A0ABR1R8X7_9PEZI
MGQGQSSGGAAISGAVTGTMMDNFHTFIQYTSAAYCNSDPAQMKTKISCSGNACPEIQAHDTHIVTTLEGTERPSGGYIALDNTAQRIVVAFHGTRDVEDWITNIKAGLKDSDLCRGCKVHDGFQDTWNDISQTVMSVVTGLHSVHPEYRIATTGHSLGAALATLSAAHLRQAMQGVPVDAYLYGSPRVGNPEFADFVNAQSSRTEGRGSNTYRITHYDDPVPRLPGHLLGYAHLDTEFWLAPGGATKIDYTPADVKVCLGTYNQNCNSGTEFGDLDVKAHGYYLQKVSTCKMA